MTGRQRAGATGTVEAASRDPVTAARRAPGGGVETLVETVRRHAAQAGRRPATTFLDYGTDRSGTPSTLTYADLDLRARATAAYLQRWVAPGGRVAILCPHDASYVIAFLAALYAGTVAVPLFAPSAYRSNLRLKTAILDSEPDCVLTSSASERATHRALAGELALPEHAGRVLAVERVPDGGAAGWRPPPSDAGALAYLQYTSGSTRQPAGVCVTHANLAHALAQQREASRFLDSSVLVSWLPFFHDMGLVSAIGMPLSAGAHAVHLSPYAFLKQPLRWLRAISDYRGTWSAAPDFAFELCLRRIGSAQVGHLDLRSLTVLANGSEPVRAATVERFATTFAPAGLSRTAHAPCYGLAEATLGVTAPPVDEALIASFVRAALAEGFVRPCRRGARGEQRMVGCGEPLRDVEVRIVDPDNGTELPQDRVGEIWARGPNVAPGYWRQPDTSAEVFDAVLGTEATDGTDGQGRGWLRTGDLGFFFDRQLFVTGRRKDVVIAGGRNHYPADIEFTVEGAHPGLTPGRVAAFGVEDGGRERLVVVAEVRHAALRARPGSGEEIAAAARAAVSLHHDLDCHDVVLVRRGGIPKTTSGKIQRSACRRQYLAGTLPAVGAGT